ncbi:branched-chain amino acid transport [Candidatus Vecturithrix granuli]|uniref:Branched-chain amino acid transport n=1 Tax=Vecturithrix granuli TaxID=1499967 RepID=A0A081C6S2_VECG1|nr:branched-chain amino acid transport [Candidatus Vecturithrix granuli]
MPISDSIFWLIVLVLTIGNYLFRLSFIAIFGQRAIPPLLDRLLRFVPVAVLPALIVPALVFQKGILYVGLENPRLIAGLLAAIVAWETENMLATIGVGMGTLWVLQVLIG